VLYYSSRLPQQISFWSSIDRFFDYEDDDEDDFAAAPLLCALCVLCGYYFFVPLLCPSAALRIFLADFGAALRMSR